MLFRSECPAQFVSAQDIFQHQRISNNEMCGVSFSQRMHDSIGLKAGNYLRRSTDSQREELDTMNTILTEEIKQLRSQVIYYHRLANTFSLFGERRKLMFLLLFKQVTALAEQCQQKNLIAQV